GQTEEIVEVAGDEARGEVGGENAKAFAQKLGRREDALLDRARDLELLLGELGLLQALDGLAQAVLEHPVGVEEQTDQERDRADDRQVAGDASEREPKMHEARDSRDPARQNP